MYKEVFSVPVQGVFHKQLKEISCHHATNEDIDTKLVDALFISVEPFYIPQAKPGVIHLLSDAHGRSYELTSQDSIFRDKFGNLFSSVSLKGGNLTEPKLFTHPIAPSGFAVWGLQDTDALFRCLCASELLRSNGINSEYIVRVFEPDGLPINEEFKPIDIFKQILIEALFTKAGEKYYPNFITDNAQKIINYVQNTAFVITARATDVGERMADFKKVEDRSEFSYMMNRIFNFVNAEQDYKYLLVDNPEDITYFFSTYLPKRMGKNFGILHSLGVSMKYSHSGNITAVGGICDLDSLRGKSLGLGDEEIGPRDRMEDLQAMFEKNGDWPPLLHLINDLLVDGYIPQSNENVVINFRNNFFIEYVKHLGNPKDLGLISVLPVIYNIFLDFQNSEAVPAHETFLQRIEEELEISYELPEEFSFDCMLNSFTQSEAEEIMNIDYLDMEIDEGRDSEAFSRFIIYRDGKITDYLKIVWREKLKMLEDTYGEFMSRNIPYMFSDREFIQAEKFAAENPEWVKNFEREIYRLRTSIVS